MILGQMVEDFNVIGESMGEFFFPEIEIEDTETGNGWYIDGRGNRIEAHDFGKNWEERFIISGLLEIQTA